MGFLQRIFKREKREGNYHPSKDPPRWLLRGNLTSSGVTVNENTARTFAAVQCAVTIISQSIAKLPLHVYQDKGDGKKERAPEHPLYRTFKKQPSVYMTPSEFKEYVVANLLLWGNHYSQILYTKGGATSLNPLRPDRMRVHQGKDLRLSYVYLHEGKQIVLSDSEVLHIKGSGSDGLQGRSVIKEGFETIGRALAANQYASDFFANFGMPAGLLEYPDALEDEEFDKIKKSWDDEFKGTGKRHGIKILEQGLKWTKIGVDPVDAQLLGIRQFEIEEVARIFNIQPHKLKHLLHATFSNIEHQNMEFYQDTILPWVCRIQESITQKFFPDDQFFVEFLFDSLLITDTKTRYEAHNLAINGGWKTPNEVRKIENLNPLDGLDKPFRPLNMGTPGDPEPQKDKKSSESSLQNEVVKAFQPIFTDLIDRALQREDIHYNNCKDKTGAAKKMEELYPKLQKQLKNELSASARSCCELSGLEYQEERLDNFIEELIERRQAQMIAVLTGKEAHKCGSATDYNKYLFCHLGLTQ